LFGAVLGVPAVLYLIDPRHRPARAAGFQRVGKLSELQKDVPQQVVLRDVRHDAWTVHPDDIIGRVWLVRRDGNKVDAYTTICPHLGCSINYDGGQKLFICPCHNGTFDLNGHNTPLASGGGDNPAPRDMDSLECRLVGDDIEVKYENFVQGEH